MCYCYYENILLALFALCLAVQPSEYCRWRFRCCCCCLLSCRREATATAAHFRIHSLIHSFILARTFTLLLIAFSRAVYCFRNITQISVCVYTETSPLWCEHHSTYEWMCILCGRADTYTDRSTSNANKRCSEKSGEKEWEHMCAHRPEKTGESKGYLVRVLTWWALLTFKIFTFNLVCNMLIHVLAQNILCEQSNRMPLAVVVCLFKFSVTFICTTCNLAITKNKEISKEKHGMWVACE